MRKGSELYNSQKKILSVVYDEPSEQVFINAASVAGITPEQAARAYRVMICDAQPTITDGQEPFPLALNSRAIETMLALEGRGRNGGINTRWLGVRYPQPDLGPRNGGFLK